MKKGIFLCASAIVLGSLSGTIAAAEMSYSGPVISVTASW
jgi:hypothetical protein